jgi:hypothetical protein
MIPKNKPRPTLDLDEKRNEKNRDLKKKFKKREGKLNFSFFCDYHKGFA